MRFCSIFLSTIFCYSDVMSMLSSDSMLLLRPLNLLAMPILVPSLDSRIFFSMILSLIPLNLDILELIPPESFEPAEITESLVP